LQCIAKTKLVFFQIIFERLPPLTAQTADFTAIHVERRIIAQFLKACS
jgi:hypothetical protein